MTVPCFTVLARLWRHRVIVCPNSKELQAVTKLSLSAIPGGGGVLIIFLGGGVPPTLKTLTLFQTIRFSIPYFRPDSQNVYPNIFQTLWGVVISATLNGLTAYGTSWRPKRCSRFFLRDQCPRQHTLLRWYPIPNRRNIHPISDQNDAIFTLFQTRNAWKWYPLGRHIPFWLIYGSTEFGCRRVASHFSPLSPLATANWVSEISQVAWPQESQLRYHVVRNGSLWTGGMIYAIGPYVLQWFHAREY